MHLADKIATTRWHNGRTDFNKQDVLALVVLVIAREDLLRLWLPTPFCVYTGSIYQLCVICVCLYGGKSAYNAYSDLNVY